MSFTNAGEKCEEQFHQCEEKSLVIEADNGDHSQTDNEGNSDESVSEFINKLKIISNVKNHNHFNTRKISAKNPVARLNVSVRYGKHGCPCMKWKKSQKYRDKKPCKKNSGKNQECLENTVVVNPVFTKMGKRCRLGGKAKGIPPEEESCDKCDSDEENDNSYFSRISLGYFQKFRDKSGASTSRQLEESYQNPSPLLTRKEEVLGKTSDEMELLELQQWGKVNLVPSKRAEKLNAAEDIGPDTF